MEIFACAAERAVPDRLSRCALVHNGAIGNATAPPASIPKNERRFMRATPLLMTNCQEIPSGGKITSIFPRIFGAFCETLSRPTAAHLSPCGETEGLRDRRHRSGDRGTMGVCVAGAFFSRLL